MNLAAGAVAGRAEQPTDEVEDPAHAYHGPDPEQSDEDRERDRPGLRTCAAVVVVVVAITASWRSTPTADVTHGVCAGVRPTINGVGPVRSGRLAARVGTLCQVCRQGARADHPAPGREGSTPATGASVDDVMFTRNSRFRTAMGFTSHARPLCQSTPLRSSGFRAGEKVSGEDRRPDMSFVTDVERLGQVAAETSKVGPVGAALSPVKG